MTLHLDILPRSQRHFWDSGIDAVPKHFVLNDGIAGAMTLYGSSLNPLDTAEAVAWFKDGQLDTLLPEATRDYLARAITAFNPHLSPIPRRATTLSATRDT